LSRTAQSAHLRTTRRPSVGAIVMLVLCAALVALAGTYVASVLWPRWPGPTATRDAPTLPISIAGVLFNVPPAAIRVPAQRHAGVQERVDLAFLWPSLDPPDPAAKPSPHEEPHPFDRLFVTIAVADSAVAPPLRLKEIYPRFLGDGPYRGPDGLAVSLFREGTPYQGEDLFFDTAGPENFTARCTRPGNGPTPGTCLYERRIGGVDLTVRFLRDWLSEWRSLVAGVDRLIARLHPKRQAP
jgi:hypothetical protein